MRRSTTNQTAIFAFGTRSVSGGAALLCLLALWILPASRVRAEEDPNQEADRLFEDVTTGGSNSLLSGTTPSGRGYALDILAAGDLVGEWDHEKNRTVVKEGRNPFDYYNNKMVEWQTEPVHATDNSASARSVELGFYASVDQLAEGTVILAAHNEEGQFHYDVHEASLYFPTTFLPRTSLKVGRFFVDAGYLNTLHQHDWHFTTAPLAHRELLADEGVSDTGGEISFLMPWKFWQELTVGVFNGRNFGHEHDATGSRQNPLVNVRLKHFFPLSGGWGVQFGLTYLRWHPDENARRHTDQSGLDLLVKWNRGALRSFQWLTEVWYRETREKRAGVFHAPPAPVQTKVGAYTFLEYQFHKQWSAGVRLDYVTEPTLQAENGYREYPPVSVRDEWGNELVLYDGWREGYAVKNGTAESSLIVTFQPSEFSRFRATVAERYDRLTREKDDLLYMQAVFLLGMHPAHRY